MVQKSHTGGVKDNYRLAIQLPIIVFLFLLSLLSSLPALAANTVIQLNYADAREVARALDGLVEPGGNVAVYQNQLIITASAENTAELKSVIEVLDEAPRKLMISVKSPGETVTDNGVFKVTRNGNTYSTNGNGGNYSVKNPDGTITQSTVRLSSYSRGAASQGRSGASQSVQALEGHDAYVRVAASTPGSQWGGSSQGFYVNARVHGKTVTVAIHTRNDRAEGEQLHTTAIDTTAQGKLGQWIPVGSLSGASRKSAQNYNTKAWNNRSSASVVYLKVELLD